MIAGLLLTLHIVVCIALIAVILLQQSEGGALGIGGGGGGFMTARGAGNLLTRATSILAACFFILSMALVFVSDRGSGSITDRLTIQDIDPTAPAAAPRDAGTAPGQPGGGLQAPVAPTPGLQSPATTPTGAPIGAPAGPISIVPAPAPAPAPASPTPASPAPAG